MTSAASVSTLPPLTAAERVHASRVAAHIREFIAAQGGAIGFDTYMRLALYAPGLGYYSAGATKFGGDGDFVTAPEISSLFSRCVARQVAEILADGGGDILELGAGLGTLAADMLTELAALDSLPAHYYILEVSAPDSRGCRPRWPSGCNGWTAGRNARCAAWCWPTKCSTPCRCRASYCAANQDSNACGRWE